MSMRVVPPPGKDETDIRAAHKGAGIDQARNRASRVGWKSIGGPSQEGRYFRNMKL